MCARARARACVRACVHVCVCVVSVIVKRPVPPPSVVDGRSRNPPYYYYYYKLYIWKQSPKCVDIASTERNTDVPCGLEQKEASSAGQD